MDIASILSRNDGFTTRAALYAAGVSKHQLQREVARGTLVPYGRDIVGSPRAPEAFQRAVHMKCRVACVTAAKATGLWVLRADAFHVVPRVNNSHAATDRAGARIHWSPSPIEPDRSRLAVESGRNALAHIADCQPLESAVATFDSALRKGFISIEELQRLASARRGRFARVVALVSGRADSGLESITRVRLAWEGVACREQVVIDGHPVDLLIGERLVIQLDGKQHQEPAQLERDRRQDRRLRRMGYTVLRYGYADVVMNWAATWAEIRSHLGLGAHRNAWA